MEIRVVGWHLELAPNTCKDCGEHAAIQVVPEESYADYFDLCRSCADSGRYTISKDEIADVFKRLGL